MNLNQLIESVGNIVVTRKEDRVVLNHIYERLLILSARRGERDNPAEADLTLAKVGHV